MNASAIEVYELFKEKWGTEEASTVIKYLDSSTEEKINAEIKLKITHLATKDDLVAVRDDIVIVREDMLKLENSLKEDIVTVREDMLKLEGSLKEDIVVNREEILKSESSLREEILKLENSMSKKHFDIIKCMLIFWLGTVGAIISVIKFL